MVQNIGGTPNETNPFVLDLTWQPPPGLEGVNASYLVTYTLVNSGFEGIDMTDLIARQMNTTDSPALRLADLLPNSTYDISVVGTYSEGDASVISEESLERVSTAGLSQDLFPSVPDDLPMPDLADSTTVTVFWTLPNVTGLSDMLLSGYQVHGYNSPRGVGNQQSRASWQLLERVDNRSATSATLRNLAFYSMYTYDVRPVYSFRGVTLYVIQGPTGTFDTGEGGVWWAGWWAG